MIKWGIFLITKNYLLRYEMMIQMDQIFFNLKILL
jgi:hypothetical protein